MKNQNKKGFTIVELVIVIAVVAILAAVLIPTFSNLVKKANQSADQQAVTNMNKLLAMSEKASNVDGVVEILVANQYKGDLSTYFAGYSLAWVESENIIVLVENNAIVFPTNYVDKGLTFEVINPMATSADALVSGLVDGKVVYVGGNITAEEGLRLESAGEYKVNLNGNTLVSSNQVGSWVSGGKLVVSNGTIDASTNDQKTSILAKESGYVELNNVQIYSASGKNPIQCYGGTMVLNNVTTAQFGEADTAWYNSAIQVINTITYPEKDPVTNKHVIYGENADLTVNGGMYTGDKAIQISAPGGNVTINNGTFIGITNVIQGDFAPQTYTHTEGKTYESVITINGGSFTGNIKISAATVLVINGGTFSINPETITTGNVTINGTVVDNGNGTWTVK